VSKLRRIRWAGHVACTRERKGAYRILVGKPDRRMQLGKPEHRWGIVLQWTFTKWDWRHGLDWCGSGLVQAAGFCECGNEPLCSTKCGEFLDKLRNCLLLKWDSAAWS